MQRSTATRSTRLSPETTVAWEGDRASGTVALEPTGWGTVALKQRPLAAPAPAPAPPQDNPPGFFARVPRRRPRPARQPAAVIPGPPVPMPDPSPPTPGPDPSPPAPGQDPSPPDPGPSPTPGPPLPEPGPPSPLPPPPAPQIHARPAAQQGALDPASTVANLPEVLDDRRGVQHRPFSRD